MLFIKGTIFKSVNQHFDMQIRQCLMLNSPCCMRIHAGNVSADTYPNGDAIVFPDADLCVRIVHPHVL